MVGVEPVSFSEPGHGPHVRRLNLQIPEVPFGESDLFADPFLFTVEHFSAPLLVGTQFISQDCGFLSPGGDVCSRFRGELVRG